MNFLKEFYKIGKSHQEVVFPPVFCIKSHVSQKREKHATMTSTKQSSAVAISHDDIERMKERAERNIMFLYIKIPDVPFIVSYKVI